MHFDSRRSTVMALNGMVATSQPLAANAGLQSMVDGGNAIDAAVTAAAVLNVVEPHSTGMGGDLFALVWEARSKQVHSLNASGRSPSTASAEELRRKGLSAVPDDSAYAVTVPGTVSGWHELVTRFGRRTLSDALVPAIRYATEGYPVSEVISMQWIGAEERLRKAVSGSELLLNGRAPQPGDAMKLPELAHSLRTIAEGGPGAFYVGELGQQIASFVQKQGGWLSRHDLENHQAKWETPISTDYRGYRVWQCPPNNQGVNVLLGLNLAEDFDLQGMGYQSADTYHHLIECTRLALADGMYHVTDSGHMKVSADDLISKAYADERRKLINSSKAMAIAPLGSPPPKSDTVYVTAVDGEGNACSLINSVYSDFGTGLVVPGTGIALQSRGASFSLDPDHPNCLEPNKRPFHTLIPGMVTKDGELWLSYGVMGTVQQAQGQIQALVNMIDFELDPQKALNAPRFSYRPVEGVVGLEPMVPEQTVTALSQRGHRVEVHESHPLFFGGGQVIQRNPETGVLFGGSEPRNDGCAIGW